MTRTPDTDPNDETTQPFSSPGPNKNQPHPIHDAMPTNHAGGDPNGGDDDHVPTLGNPEEKTVEASEINTSCLRNTVTWSDIHGQMQRVENINLDAYSDTSTNTAFFRLYCDIRIKHSKSSNNMQTVYLFIYPESIRTITFKSNVDSPACSLCFSMTQPPSLIVPRERIPDCKSRTKGLFGLMHSLAEVVDFTIHLSNSNKTTSILPSLERIAHMFSLPPNRPRTNQRYANVASLYAGRGGKAVDISIATARPPAEAGAPPSYNRSARGRTSHKRQRRDSSHSSSRSPAARDRMLHLLGSISTGISKIESQLGGMKSQLNGMEYRLGHLESNILNTLDSTRSPCRFGTEERAEVLEEIHEQIDDRTLDMKFNCDEMLRDIEKDTTRAIVQMQEEVRETLGQLENSIEETTEQLVTNGLRSRLSNASLRIDGTVFLDA